MLSIARLRAPPERGDDPWPAIAGQVAQTLRDSGIAARDAIVLVPFAQLLPPARRAFAAQAGLMPRIETTRTLAASLGPPAEAPPDAPSREAALDRLLARQLLARQGWGADWQRRDRRGFDLAAARIAAAASEVADAASRIPPVQRDAWWQSVRATLTLGSGPGGRERALARIAFEWAAQAPTPRSDSLFSLRPAAWVVIECGGSDAFVEALLRDSTAPAFVVETDAAPDSPFAHLDAAAAPSCAVFDAFEREAQAATAQVLEHLRRGERPVALVAEDRVMVRRIRALLEPSGAVLLDETGWKLSTTRAAATVMSMLVAARHDASSDQLFEWLKSGTRWRDHVPHGVAKLEAVCRRRGAWRVEAVAALVLDDAQALRVRHEALAVLESLRSPERQDLDAWIEAIRAALADSGALDGLRNDAAGQQLLAALGLDAGSPSDARRRFAQAGGSMSLAECIAWVDEVFEDATFRPPLAADAWVDDSGPDVVVTPLARTPLRPFAAAVFPGADDKRLGAFKSRDSLFTSATREALGMPDPESRRRAELLAFAQLLSLPHVTLLRRRADGTEPLATSSFVERVSLALLERGAALRDWHDPRSEIAVAPAPTGRATARSGAPARVPVRVSASAFEALRACPYQFFARSMLGLGEDEELDGDIEKRDYGSWLHEVLHDFHVDRASRGTDGVDLLADRAALHAAGERVLARQALAAADFLPWAATFAAFAPRYIRWLHAREQAGARWAAGESARSLALPGIDGIELYGVIDRIDSLGEAEAASLALIDYKTGSETTLRDRTKDRFEDTQLAFYAALVCGEEPRSLKASYLALEARPELVEIEHRDVTVSARALLQGAATELTRLRQGAALLPLGDGDACRYCKARGLCRRDHWSTVDADARNGVAAVADPDALATADADGAFVDQVDAGRVGTQASLF